MMSDNSIPVMNQPVNMMEAGPNGNNLQAQALQKHPIDQMQQQQGASYFTAAFAFTKQWFAIVLISSLFD